MKRPVLFLTVMLLSLGCIQRNDRLRNGDLVFVGLPVGYDAGTDFMDAAISESTGRGDTLNLIHVAIAEVKADSVWIIDATIAHGVDRHPLDTFLTDFTLKDGSYPAFIVKRVKGIDADAAVDRAKTFCAGRLAEQSSPALVGLRSRVHLRWKALHSMSQLMQAAGKARKLGPGRRMILLR